MDKPLSWKSADGMQGFEAVLHFNWNGSQFHGADVQCRKMSLSGIDEDAFLKLCFDGIDNEAKKYDAPEPAPPASDAT